MVSIIFSKPNNPNIVYAQSLTCPKKCERDFQRYGGCRTKERVESEGLLEQLNQGKTYCEKEEESCYCFNRKPGVDWVVFNLDVDYFNHISKIYSTTNWDVISEYDIKHLVCQANIYDSDPEDFEKMKNNAYRPDFKILYGWTSNDIFQPLITIQNENIKCSPTVFINTINCKASMPPFISKEKIKNGMLLKCQVTPKDPYQEGNPKTSNILAVADHLYHFLKTSLKTNPLNISEQYLFYVNKSAVTINLWGIKDRTERIGKDYVYSSALPVLVETPEKVEGMSLEEIEKWWNALCERIRTQALRAGVRYKREKDDKIILVSDLVIWALEKFNGIEHKLVGIPILYHGFATDLGSDIIFLSDENPEYRTFAHEMGHASIDSCLCDEYNILAWLKSGDEERPCPNPFPNCCNEKNECGTLEACPGMPYYPDVNTPQPNYNKATSAFSPQWYSIMSGWPPPFKEIIYPKEAQCPLRNCK